MKLSVVIPSYKDPYLKKHIYSLLDNSDLGDQLEIVVTLDGYWLAPEMIINDPRVKYIHLGKNVGMREAINTAVRAAKGEFLMRTDEHCMFSPGYDKKMTDSCKENWIMTARRFFLDPVKWEVMELAPVDHEKLVIQGGKKFAGQRWASRDEEQKDKMISETMAMQGSMWLMPRAWWNKVIVNLQTEGYGPLIQDSHEMVFKTWKAGGKLMINKDVWFAHKHRSFSRTHNNGTKENPAKNEDGYAYALKVWKDYYENEIKPKWKL